MKWSTFATRAVKQLASEVPYGLGLTPTEIKRTFQAELRIYGAWYTSMNRATAFHAAMAIPGTSITDFLPKLLKLPCGAMFVGPRFIGGDPMKPFIQVYAYDSPVLFSDAMKSSLQMVLEHFQAFNVSAVRIKTPTAAGSHPSIREKVDFVTYAAPLIEIAAGDNQSRPDVTVRLAHDRDLWTFYASAYRHFHASSPDLASVVLPLSQADFQDSLSQNEVFEIRLAQLRAGLFIARPAYRDGMHGYMLKDEILDTPFRFRGLAAHAQRRLARLLLGGRRNVLFGVIAPENLPSVRAAEKAGRIALSKCSFLSPI